MVDTDLLLKTGKQMVIAVIGGTAAGIFIQAPLISDSIVAVGYSIISSLLLIAGGMTILYGSELITSNDPIREGKGTIIFIILTLALVGLFAFTNIFGITRFGA